MAGTLVLLGGSGGAGRALAPLLLRETDARLLIAGRTPARAKTVAEGLGRPDRVAWAQADATRPGEVRALLAPGDMLLDLTTAGHMAPALASAALDAGADFLDIHYQLAAAQALAQLDARFRAAGRLLLTQAGCHPGLPAVMVRAAALRLPGMDRARLAMALRFRVESPATALELVEEMGSAKGLLYADGAWREPRGGGPLRMDLGPRFGPRTCYAMTLPELLALPEALGLRELGLRVAGFNPLADVLALPLILLCARLGLERAKPLLARLFTFCVNALPQRPTAISFVLEGRCGEGPKAQGTRLLIDADSPYGLTAWPVVSCLRQHLREPLAPGLRYLGHVAEPARLLEDIRRMGANVVWS